MDLALWIGQGLLAAIFLLSGGAKISMSKLRLLATGQTGVTPFPLPAIRLVAACELVAVVGLVGPGATGILPALTGFVGVGLAVVMVGAMASHASLHEPRAVAVNPVTLLVCCFVAVGRLSGR
jgi:riboflavin synthase